MIVWIGGILLYLTLAAAMRPRPYLSLYRAFILASCTRSLFRLAIWIWWPEYYRPAFWPAYWALCVFAVCACRQALNHGETFVFVGFWIYYGIDLFLRPFPTNCEGIQLVKMTPAALAAAWWLYGERKHVVAI